MHRASAKADGVRRAAWLLGLLGLIAVETQLVAAAAPATPSSAPSYSVELNYHETDEVLAGHSLDCKVRANPFLKEPPAGRKDVFRGSLLLPSQGGQATSFLWDKGNGRLFLDLNHNDDLTDDSPGVFFCPAKGDNQTFTNIHWALPAAPGKRTVRLELEFYASSGRGLRVYAGLCYLWQARVALHGKEWQLGLVETEVSPQASTPPHYLLLRPWSERQRPFHLQSATPDFCTFTTNLFFGNHAYTLDWRYEPGGAAGSYRVTLAEQSPRLGELNVTGARSPSPDPDRQPRLGDAPCFWTSPKARSRFPSAPIPWPKSGCGRASLSLSNRMPASFASRKGAPRS